MEIEELDETVDYLENIIKEFPVGAVCMEDFKSIEEKIFDIREHLKTIDARKLTYLAMIDMGKSQGSPNEEDLNTTMENLNASTSNLSINSHALKLCLQSKAIHNILYNNAGTEEIQNKMDSYSKMLFLLNDKLMSKNETKLELLKKQYQLKIDCHQALYDYQDFLNEKKKKRNKLLQESNPNLVRNKEYVDKTIYKINTMKKLMTNLIAAMGKKLDEEEELINLLFKHKEIFNLNKLMEIIKTKSND